MTAAGLIEALQSATPAEIDLVRKLLRVGDSYTKVASPNDIRPKPKEE